jgi:polyphosphate kinase
VRGICCLRPGIRGISENIRVMSVIGRFLEHSRIWSFGNGGSAEFYIGSADWMPRNFDRRVEAVVPVESPELRQRLASLFATYMKDERQVWELAADGTWHQRPGVHTETASHDIFLRQPWGQADAASATVSDEKISREGATISTGRPATLASNSDL